ncbi:hypothetical protein HPB51_013479 [Rhipicephalus microplus]|uniref:HTH CENPB-type domain-containing protein n=1 Tax=Rhipicephalus microplus TaxID=6941 RepID=A0A9J6ENG4_RHIMP|nr:hypothetical protein HPB51_013479 [Rhipicephalus microplus]
MGRYASFTAAFKLKALDYALEHGNHAAGRHFGIDEIRIRYWKKQRDMLMTTNSMRWAFRGPKSGKFPDIEKAVLEYVKDMRKDGYAVSLDMIRAQTCSFLEAWNSHKGQPRQFRLDDKLLGAEWTVAGISNALNGMEDDPLWDNENTAGFDS